jgi:WD40 repeat protein
MEDTFLFLPYGYEIIKKLDEIGVTDQNVLYTGSTGKVICHLLSPINTSIEIKGVEPDINSGIVISSDGQYLYSGCKDNTIKEWSLSTGQCMRIFSGHAKCIKHIIISPDGKYLYSGSVDCKIIQWSLSSGNPDYVFEEHTKCIKCLVISSDGKCLYSGSYDNNIIKWNTFDGVRKLLKGHKNEVNCLALSSDEKYLFSGSEDGCIIQWDTTTCANIKVISRSNTFINNLIVLPDYRCFYTIDPYPEGSIIEHNLNNDAQKEIEEGGRVYILALSPDKRHLFSGSKDGKIKQWDISTGKCIGVIQNRGALKCMVLVNKKVLEIPKTMVST